jgi:hypothetical protein
MNMRRCWSKTSLTDQSLEGKKRMQMQQRQAHLLWDRKERHQDAMEITLPYLPDAVIVVDDMLGKVPKLRYVDHDVRDG